jgi:hypothetical protein
MFHNSYYHLHFFETLHIKMFFRHSMKKRRKRRRQEF